MSRILWTTIRTLIAAGLFVVGGSNTDRSGPWSMIPWAWLDANYIAVACFSLAVIVVLYSPLRWWIERQNLMDVRNRIRSSLTPGTFHETDGAEALRYLLRESVWGWRAYAKFNSWELVDGMQRWEFERAAKEGEILTTGFASRANAVQTIDRRYWVDGHIDPQTEAKPYGVVMSVGIDSLRRMTWSQIAVATADMKAAWPPASFSRRAWARVWVWLKSFWYGSCLSNWLDARRRQKEKSTAA